MKEASDISTFHDHENHRKFMKTLLGYRISRSSKVAENLGKMNVKAIFIGLFLLLILNFTTLVLATDRMLLFRAFHLFILWLVSFVGLSTRTFHHQELDRALDSIREGVYRYEGEMSFPEHTRIKEQCVKEIRSVSDFFYVALMFRGLFNIFAHPLIEYSYRKEDTGDSPVNLLMPQPFYMPFNTDTYLGFTVAFLINAAFLMYMVSYGCCIDEYYTSLTMQLKSQFEILNHSLLNIEKRALRKMQEENHTNIQELYFTKKFQDCMYSCLRSNVLHYHAILRLDKDVKGYCGDNFLFVISAAALILAASLTALTTFIMENPTSYKYANLLVEFSSEVLFTFHFCWHGEVLIQESSKLFHSLYGMPWMYCDKRFNTMVSIMMERSKKPMMIKTSIFDFKARMETFGDILTKVYQILNLMRKTL